MKKYSLIATDLDGTLISRVGSFPKKNKEALEYLKEKDVILIASTGRNYPLLHGEISNLPYFDYYITSNGACLYQANPLKLISSHLIKYETLKSFVTSVLPLSSGLRLLYLDRVMAIEDDFFRSLTVLSKVYPKKAKMLKTYLSNFTIAEDMLKYIDEHIEDVTKIDVNLKGDKEYKEYLEILKNYPSLHSCLCFKNSVEVTDINATKGKTLSDLTDTLSINKDEVLGFGDSGNDLSIKDEGFDFCALKNSSMWVKDKANYVTDKNAGSAGFADFIFKNIK